METRAARPAPPRPGKTGRPSPSVVAGVAGGQFHLAAHVAPSGAGRRCAHDPTGRRALRHGLARQGVTRVAGEAPGRSHRQLQQGLPTAGLETVGANPQHARRCAEALGKLAQTDRVEAAMLARLEDFKAAPPASQKLLELQDWEATRRLLAQEREALGKHLQEVSLEACRRELRAVLRVLNRRLQRLQASLAATLATPAGSSPGPPSPPPAATRPCGPAPQGGPAAKAGRPARRTPSLTVAPAPGSSPQTGPRACLGRHALTGINTAYS